MTNLRDRDNLSTRDKGHFPKAPFTRRLHCRPVSVGDRDRGRWTRTGTGTEGENLAWPIQPNLVNYYQINQIGSRSWPFRSTLVEKGYGHIHQRWSRDNSSVNGYIPVVDEYVLTYKFSLLPRIVVSKSLGMRLIPFIPGCPSLQYDCTHLSSPVSLVDTSSLLAPLPPLPSIPFSVAAGPLL